MKILVIPVFPVPASWHPTRPNKARPTADGSGFNWCLSELGRPGHSDGFELLKRELGEAGSQRKFALAAGPDEIFRA